MMPCRITSPILTTHPQSSHIFCIECFQQHGVVGQENQRRATCPTCNAPLAKAEDIAIVRLNPTEEFKTNVLSGLNPGLIMECAGRGISFWVYQASQNLHYQQHLYKKLSEKYAALCTQLEHSSRDANAEIKLLHEKLNSS